MHELWRLFVAVSVPAAVRADLAKQLAPLRVAAPDGIHWIDPASWHLTLTFLGDTDPARVPAVVTALRDAVTVLPAFTAHIRGVGAFRRPPSARVIWLGVDGGDELPRLASVVAAACGIRREEPFRAHITLARLRGHVAAVDWIGGLNPIARPLPVREISLLRSRHATHPTTYQAVDRPMLLSGRSSAD